MQVVTVCNQKGGVSKTTTVWALGAGLHKRGYSVLMVDLDAQSNLSFTAGVDLLGVEKSLYEVFKGKADINDAVITLEIGLDILVGSIDLASADREFTGAKLFYMLRDALKQLNKEYDYCIIDTPPTLGVLTENALAASDKLIIPMKTEIYALQGVGQLGSFIEEQQKYTNPDLVTDGILITCVDERTNLAKTMLNEFEEVADNLGTKVYKSRIRSAVAVGECALRQSNLFDEAPNATATKDYQAFIDEFLQGDN